MSAPEVRPVPLPSADSVDYESPSLDDVVMMHNGIEFAAAPSGGLTQLQSLVWVEQCIAMTGFTPEASWRRPVGIQGFAEALAPRDWVFRVRMLQAIILIGMLARPAPPELGAKLRAVARALNVGDEIINAIERFGATLMRGEGCRTLVRRVSWPLNSIDWR